ncbi:MAG TPA: succinate dehydrogenase assembly factor 2 [Rudaea sp.]|jgi:antitoxin CptB|nr:succinate dehydrogenase assembly factor 2 [Rudaea sp.]
MSGDDSRLRWRCRRGMRELDQLLTWYLQHRYPATTDAEKHSFATLLDEQDPDLWNWFSCRAEPPDAWKHIVDEIRTADRV